MVRQIEYRQLASIISLFLIVQLLGLLIAFYLISPEQLYVSTVSTSSSEIVFYFIYIVIAAVVMVFLFKIYRGNMLFRVIEAVVVVSASFYLFLIILGSLLPQIGAYAILVSFGASVVLIAAKNKWPQLRNLTAVIASIGVGVVLGSYFSFFAAYALMAFIAAYDYVAVFITRHMIALGRESVNRNLSFMIGSYDIEIVPKRYLKENEILELKKSFKASRIKSDVLRRLMKEGNFPMPSFSALGTGDLAIPLMLAISSYVTYFKYFMSLLIILGASIGLLFAMFISKRYKVALPAIPPLFAFTSIVLGVNFVILMPGEWHVYAPLLVASFAILALMLFSARKQSKIGEKSRILYRPAR